MLEVEKAVRIRKDDHLHTGRSGDGPTMKAQMLVVFPFAVFESGVIRGVARRVKSCFSGQNRTIAYDFTHIEGCMSLYSW